MKRAKYQLITDQTELNVTLDCSTSLLHVSWQCTRLKDTANRLLASLLCEHGHPGTTATGGLRVLALDLQAPVVTQSPAHTQHVISKPQK